MVANLPRAETATARRVTNSPSARPAPPAIPRRDLRSVRVQQQLALHWRQVVRRQPPGTRAAWLRTPEAIVALGAKLVHDLRRELGRRRRLLEESVPGEAWLAGAWDGDAVFPPGEADSAWPAGVRPVACANLFVLRRAMGIDSLDRVRGWLADPFWPFGAGPWDASTVEEIGRWLIHRYGQRMRISAVATSRGTAGADPGHLPLCAPPTHRYFPPIAAEVEDLLDGMDWLEAIRYSHPQSVSAHAIITIRNFKGRCEDRRGRMGRLRGRTGRKMADT